MLALSAAHGDERSRSLSEPLAEAFGAPPFIRDLHLSPDGTEISFLQPRPEGGELVRVFDTRSQSTTTPLASGGRDGDDVRWCRWKNDTRLVCGLLGREKLDWRRVEWQGLVSLNVDGSKPLLLRRRSGALAKLQFEDRVIDWLPDDPEHVLLGVSIGPPGILNSREILKGPYTPYLTGASIRRLNVYDNQRPLEPGQGAALAWVADGHGIARLAATVGDPRRTWSVRTENGWLPFHDADLGEQTDVFSPVGFDPSTNEALFFDRQDGRTALFAMDPKNSDSRRLVYSHPEVDLAGVYRLGKYDRVVAAVYTDDRPKLHFFDQRIERVREMLSTEFAGMTIDVVDEDWSERHYVVFVHSDEDPGTYYLFDNTTGVLSRFGPAYPALAEQGLSGTRRVSYSASDGRELKSYLTLPKGATAGHPARAAVVLPFGEARSLDYWELDFVAQYLAASGYAVLRTHYRASATGFVDWKRAVADASAGAKYLVDSQIVAPDRICLVGWAGGAYAALLGAMEHREQYRCVVGIASAMDPIVASATAMEPDDELRHAGSLADRALDLDIPTLLFHGVEDAEAPFEQVERLVGALRKASRDVSLVRYANTGTDIAAGRNRIDMLTRLGVFLGAHLGHETGYFSSRAVDDAVPPDLVDFGSDVLPMDGQCSDRRFRHGGGRLLTDPVVASGRPTSSRQDATECRRLFRENELVLLDDIAYDASGSAAAKNRATMFVDPPQQDRAAIVWFDGNATNAENAGVAVVLARPGLHTVSVRRTGADYGCTIAFRRGGIPSDVPSRNDYQAVARGSDIGVDFSEAQIAAHAGHYYRIRAEVEDRVLLLRVTDVTEGRVVLDHRELIPSECPKAG
jgi:dipeptidyl aminopeptidase/acylaminoacyl peptidase